MTDHTLSPGTSQPGTLVLRTVGTCHLDMPHLVEVFGEQRVIADLDDALADLDAPKVERIVENLLANAARHTPPGTPVWVHVRAQPDGVLITVEDAGPGVPADQRETIFEPFHQVGGEVPGSLRAPGVGVGLALVARFAELHGGHAWVEERAGGGASFRVLLPNRGPAAPARDPADVAAGG